MLCIIKHYNQTILTVNDHLNETDNQKIIVKNKEIKHCKTSVKNQLTLKFEKKNEMKNVFQNLILNSQLSVRCNSQLLQLQSLSQFCSHTQSLSDILCHHCLSSSDLNDIKYDDF